MPLQPQEGPHRQADVIALRFSTTGLTPLDAAELLDTPMIVLQDLRKNPVERRIPELLGQGIIQ